MSFPDHLVQSILGLFSPRPKEVFLDPYCGSGTAVVEAQRYGLRCFGIDANPVSVLASKVKTSLLPAPRAVQALVDRLENEKHTLSSDTSDPIFQYLFHSGMIERGWITEEIASTAIALKRWIERTTRQGPLSRFFMLALVTTVVADLANVKFGPEIYCIPGPENPPDVFGCFSCRVERMLDDLIDRTETTSDAHIRLGDSRDGRTMRSAAKWGEGPVYVITSPPYPTEHDYTRNARLELVFIEAVDSLQSLRAIKRRMLRSHSKGIYVGDKDYRDVREFGPVRDIVTQIDGRIKDRTSGFEGQYGKVIGNYFGGMLRHFRALERYLDTGSKLAYVVGDEASYKGVFVPTSEVLVSIIDAHLHRMRVDEVVLWRSRRPAKGRQRLDERVIILNVE